MSKIPDVSPSFDSLGNPPVPVSDRPIVTTDLSAVPKAISSSAEQIGNTAMDIYNQQGELDAQFAKSNYLTAMIQTQKDEENNPDWQGAPQRWNDASQAALQKASGSIANPRYQAKFQAEAGDLSRYQYQNFLQQVDVKRRQAGAGQVEQALQNNTTSALSAPDDVTTTNIINNTNEILKNASANGFITPAQEVNMRTEWTKNYLNAKKDQYLANGDAEGARDYFNKHYNMINPTPQQVAQMNTAVTVPRANGATDRIVNGGSTPNPGLAAAQEQMESGGNQSAVSQKGALGVMQLLPSTAEEVANKMGIPFDPEKLKNDPVYNRLLGNEYRNEMISRYHGNQTLALAAYNAGPGNVDKWISQFGNPNVGQISDEDFIKKIPFDETRNYVTAINAKAPPTPGVPFDGIDPVKSQQAWLDAANTMPPSIQPLVSTGIQTRINAGIQQAQDTQTGAANTLSAPIFNGKISDPSQLMAPEMQTAWSNAAPELQKSILGALKDSKKESTEFGPKFWDLYKAVHAPDGDPTKITDPTTFYQYGDGNGLTLKGIQQLSSEIDSKKTAEGAARSAMQAQTFKVIKSNLSGEDEGLSMKDPKGEAIFAQAMPMVYKAIADGEKKGIPDSQLYDPKSPNWVGNVTKGMARSPDQWHADMVGSNLEDAPPAPGIGATIGKYLNPFNNTAETDAKTAALENDFKSGKYSTDQTKPEGLNALKQAAANKTITKEKFMQLAVEYGYARGK